VLIHLEGREGQEREGRISRILPPADPQSRSFRIKIALLKQDRRLLPGLLANGQVMLKSQGHALVLPVAALIADTPGAREGEVYVVEKDLAHRRRLSLGARYGDRIEIRSGVTEGEQVVLEGQQMLSEGRHIQTGL